MSFKCLCLGSDPIVIQFIGAMTEDADLSMLRFPSTARLELDLSQLTAINSIGIRELRNWSGRLQNSDLKVMFAPKCFIDQINMVPDLIPRTAEITSFYVPYYDEESGEEQRSLFTRDREFTPDQGSGYKLNLPTVVDSSGHAMEPDVIASSYFSFLNKR